MSNYDEFMQGVDDVNQDAVEEHGNRYPLIQWVKGDLRYVSIWPMLFIPLIIVSHFKAIQTGA